MTDAKAFGLELAEIVKSATRPLLARLDALDKRIDGLPVPINGKDADSDEIAAMVRDLIKADIDAMPVPTLSAGDLEALTGSVQARALEAVQQAAEAFLDTVPTPKDGEDGASVTVDDIAPLIATEVEKAVRAIPAPKDGVGLADAFIDREDTLILTMTDGRAVKLGVVVGKDADPAEPGKDGLGFEDMDFEERDGRLYAVFRRGDAVKECRIPSMSYRGTWRKGDYLKGDVVTWGGSSFTARVDTASKPETDDTWQLAVKRGRDAPSQKAGS